MRHKDGAQRPSPELASAGFTKAAAADPCGGITTGFTTAPTTPAPQILGETSGYLKLVFGATPPGCSDRRPDAA